MSKLCLIPRKFIKKYNIFFTVYMGRWDRVSGKIISITSNDDRKNTGTLDTAITAAQGKN